ncbi:MAG: hypothetical protein CEN91_460 [Candidatus Berkelbacteria bacterium Licking1014_85]|uniref:Nucleotidyltransferase n=1 Tax=Candidatus Berkelbacteria bacterium Licking1014_85 TaxID=2017148 RepID=A0A554LHQ3_9BACT|nr:MAG: hypothetical protein CEN91_460 [Candidatus Berkelbacteria bacterium Licking1014_85]
MTNEKDRWRLNHIVEAIEYIEEFVGNISKDKFFDDYEKQSAVIRQFEIIGETANNLSPDFVNHYPQVNWSEVVSMRNAMIHDYFEVNIEIVWDTIKVDLPKLKSEINLILTKIE